MTVLIEKQLSSILKVSVFVQLLNEFVYFLIGEHEGEKEAFSLF